MSLSVTAAIWANSRARGSQLLVLLAIGDYADGAGTAWPAVSSLARKARLSVRETQRVTARLIEDGELAVVRSRGLRNVYRVTCAVAWVPAPGAVGRAAAMARGATPAPPDGGERDAANKEVERSTNGKRGKEGSPLSESTGSVPAALADFDAELRGCPGYDPDARFYEKVLGRYGGLDLEEEAIRIAGWLADVPNRKRLCTRGFVLGWLRRELQREGRDVEGVKRSGGARKELGGLAGLQRFG